MGVENFLFIYKDLDSKPPNVEGGNEPYPPTMVGTKYRTN
jgi:hypothetical protein